MTFSGSGPKDITEGIPVELSRASDASSQVFTSRGLPFDVAIGGIAFIMAASEQRPQQRQTAPFQKDQIDTSKEAGEQTLDGYWIRSQTSWHKGAGVRFYEPTSDPDTAFRFEDSLGVDVWNKDNLTLLKAMTQMASVSVGQGAYVTGAIVGGANVLFTNENGTIHRRDATGANLQTYSAAFAAPAFGVAVGGKKIFADMGSFGIASGDASGTGMATLYSQALGTTPRVYWAKSRLIATRGTNIYELAPDGSSGSTPGDLDTVTPIFTHTDADWTWSDVAEGPDAIYASGYSNGRTAIFQFSLQDATSGTVPQLSQGYQVAELPLGEEVYCINIALGLYMAIGTTKGVRIALIDSNGSLTLGPLLFTTTNPVRCLTTGDRFFYAGIEAGHPDGLSGAVRIDLSEAIGSSGQVYPYTRPLRFPYAWDARMGISGGVASICMLGSSDRVCMSSIGAGIYGQSATVYETSGWVRSGRIRYSTVEKKMFRTLEVGNQLYTGSLTAYSVDEDGDELYLRTITSDSNSETISLSGQHGIYEFLRFKMVLTSSPDHLTTPILNSVQVRALPAVKRQRLIEFPLLCMDYELFASGTKSGHDGFALERLHGLEAVEENGLVVLVQDVLSNESYEASIEKISFIRPGPRSVDVRTNFGGFLTVLVRKL